MTEHVSDISFDRASVHELSSDEAQRMEQHLADCARCRQRQRFLAEDRAAFLTAAPSFQAYRAARGPAQSPKKSSLWWPLAAA
ncbi:MAG TPA: zf-HC2 domain-containing protein, partial [Polyangiales bacterium]|nr:zf-HC2 domain-containing protein [Polyangiales bacterium]